MKKPILEVVRKHLKDNRGRLPFIATETGIPYDTITKISAGSTANPGVNQIQTLYDYFMRNPDEE